MRVYSATAPAGITVVTVLRAPGVLVTLMPDGIDQAVALEQLVGQLEPAERDEIRMAYGRAPVGADAGPTWGQLAGRPWSIDIVPAHLRLTAPTSPVKPLPLPTRWDRAVARARRVRSHLEVATIELATGGHLDGLGAMNGRRFAFTYATLIAAVCLSRIGLELVDLGIDVDSYT